MGYSISLGSTVYARYFYISEAVTLDFAGFIISKSKRIDILYSVRERHASDLLIFFLFRTGTRKRLIAPCQEGDERLFVKIVTG